MSNAGQAALTIVGGAIGFYLGGPAGAAWGMQLGGLAGSVAFPTDLGTTKGPRLNDLNTQISTVGAPIPIVYGAYAISGNVIWSSGIIETVSKKKQGGKGGPTQTLKTYSYKVNVAVGVCEGPISGILRIWADAQLLYDEREQQPEETTAEYTARLEANTRVASYFSVYIGSEDQLPDPTIETFDGIGNISGFRNLAYVVFNNFELADYGNRIPQFRFEVLRCFVGGLVGPQPLTIKPVDEWRDSSAAPAPDAYLTFATEANKNYWILGKAVAQQDYLLIPKGIRYTIEHTGDTVGLVSKDAIWNLFHSASTTYADWAREFRKLSEFGTVYGDRLNAYSDTARKQYLNQYWVDTMLAVGATGGDVALKWGTSVQTAGGRTRVYGNGSWLAQIELDPALGWGFVTKSATTQRTTATLAADPDLQFGLDADSTYHIRGTLFLRAPAAAGMSIAVTAAGCARAAGFVTADYTMYSAAYESGDESGALAYENVTALIPRPIAGGGDDTTYVDYGTHYEFTVTVQTSAATTFEINWAQVLAHAGAPAEILAGSSIAYRKLPDSGTQGVNWVVKHADESRLNASVPFADDSELSIELEADRFYFLEIQLMTWGQNEYGQSVRAKFDFSGDAYLYDNISDTHYVYYLNGWLANSAYRRGRTLAASIDDEVAINSQDFGSDSGFRGGTRNRIYIKTGPRGGTFKVVWKKNNHDGGRAVRMIGGSYMIAHDLEFTSAGSSCAITLGDIVDDVSNRCGLSDAQIDVSDLTELVDGYVITRPMSGRDAISPLRTFGWFDCVESGGQLKWPTRGKAAVATLTDDDLGAHLTGDARPSSMEIVRGQEVELPKRLRVHYAQTAKNCEPGEQGASRISVGTAEVRDIEVAVAMSDNKAAQIADVVLYDLWVSRSGYRTTLDQAWFLLEPGDAITAPVDGRQERLRIKDIGLALPGLLHLDLVRDDDGVYTSYAIGAPTVRPGGGGGVTSTGVADLILMDLPLLQDADNDAGYYAAVQAVGGTSFGGATLFRSPDGGITYGDVGTFVNEATIGAVYAPLPAGLSTVIDYTTDLVVEVDDDLESVVLTSLLAGLNAAAIGDDGRWEIVQYLNAEAITSPVIGYRLTGLLRGRRGTEWAMGSGLAGDRFVLLDSAVIRVASNLASIGLDRPHKAALSGVSLDDSPIENFTALGVALKPFSVVDVEGSRDMSDNLTVTWKRRGRIGQELPSGADIPLSEDTEAYEVDVLDGVTVVRTIAVTAQTASYTAAEQTTDFGSPQSSVDVMVYQRSASIGRGYPAEATI